MQSQKVRGGIGEAYSRLLAGVGARVDTNLLALAVNRLPSGSTWGPHKHRDREEAFIVLEGKAEVLDNGERVFLERYDVVIAQAGEMLAIRNAGDSELVFMGLVIRTKSSWMGRFG